MNNENITIREFLKDSEHTGRFLVKSPSGRTFWVEAIAPRNYTCQWGDVNPATKTVEGNYGKKYKGSIEEGESMITEENFGKIYRFRKKSVL